MAFLAFILSLNIENHLETIDYKRSISNFLR